MPEGRTTPARTERDVLDAIEDRRRRPVRRLATDQVTLSHGAGGRASRDLIESVFLGHLGNPALNPLDDSAVLGISPGTSRLAFSTDSFVVKPLFFPGADIGKLAVHGTVNDLAVSGARPLALSAGFIIEEGFPISSLERIAASIAAAGAEAGVAVAAADTKVVERGKADGVYINTSGVGALRPGVELSTARIRAGDRLIVSGTIGDHGMAIMVSRGELSLEADLESDTAPLGGLVEALLDATDGVRCMRDPTRGGLATVLAEMALASELGFAVSEAALPVRPEVAGACEILGIDPLHVANEGKLLAIVEEHGAERALAALRAHPLGTDAAIIGEVRPEPPGMVLLETSFGGGRVIDMLAGDPLPRIC